MRRTPIKYWYRKCCKLAEKLIRVKGIITEVNLQHNDTSLSTYLSIYDIDKNEHTLSPGKYIADYYSEEENAETFKEYESVVENYLNRK